MAYTINMNITVSYDEITSSDLTLLFYTNNGTSSPDYLFCYTSINTQQLPSNSTSSTLDLSFSYDDIEPYYFNVVILNADDTPASNYITVAVNTTDVVVDTPTSMITYTVTYETTVTDTKGTVTPTITYTTQGAP